MSSPTSSSSRQGERAEPAKRAVQALGDERDWEHALPGVVMSMIPTSSLHLHAKEHRGRITAGAVKDNIDREGFL
jgi:hypothetical protein